MKGKPIRTLVADDDLLIRQIVEMTLARVGHDVAVAADGKDAKRLFKAERFDLAIVDVLMPEADGFEVIADLRKHSPETRILAISGGGEYMKREMCVRMASQLGAHATLDKPFGPDELKAAISRLIAVVPAK